METKNNKKKLMIFDMDGTLFDTSKANYLAYKEAAATIGYDIEHDKFMETFVGKNYKEFLPLFGICQDEELSQVHKLKKACYYNYMKCIKPNVSLIDFARNRGEESYIALATTASKKNTEEILEYFGLNDLFDYVITQEEVGALKPNPECYIRVMDKLAISPENTIIFEDSLTGIKAALASKAQYVRVNNYLPKDIRINKSILKNICQKSKKESSNVRYIDFYYYMLFDKGMEDLVELSKENNHIMVDEIKKYFTEKKFYELMFMADSQVEKSKEKLLDLCLYL